MEVESPWDDVAVKEVAVYDRVFPGVAMDTALGPSWEMAPSVVSLVADERTTLVVVDMVVFILFNPA